MERAVHRVFLALGSNIEPEQHLPQAVQRLKRYGTLVAVSHVWQSPPFGDPNQADFLNAAVLLETTRSAEAIVTRVIPEVENALGRRRTPGNKNGPRTIDIDLSLYDRDVLTVAVKSIPNPSILFYPFFALPLAVMDPSYLHPTTGEALINIAERLVAENPTMVRREDVRLDALVSSPTPRSR